MLPAPKTCVMCNAPLWAHRTQAGRLCDSPKCQWEHSRVPPYLACTVCGRRLAPPELAAKVCADPECQRAVMAEWGREQRERERREAEARREQGRQCRDREAAAAGVPEPESYPVAVVPSFPNPVGNLPERRRRLFRDHLLRLIGEATVGRRAPTAGEAVPARPYEDRDPVHAVLGEGCAACRGYCCRSGGNHAWMTPDTVRHYLDTHPGARPRDVLAAYLAYLRPRHVLGSCVFHQADGCALPREMRADTCNRHLCTGLKELRQVLTGEGSGRAFVAACGDGGVAAAAFIDINEVRVLRAPALGARNR